MISTVVKHTKLKGLRGVMAPIAAQRLFATAHLLSTRAQTIDATPGSSALLQCLPDAVFSASSELPERSDPLQSALQHLGFMASALAVSGLPCSQTDVARLVLLVPALVHVPLALPAVSAQAFPSLDHPLSEIILEKNRLSELSALAENSRFTRRDGQKHR